ncbi:MAG: radical SAM/SPASM domain-containing protein [Planctomycetota bacterium]
MSYKSNLDKVTRTSEADDFPEVVLIDNLNACNLKCSMCDHKNIKNFRPIQKMEFDLYKRIIDEVAVINPGARIWEIFYGDPFLCIDMADRIKYAKEKDLTDVVLNSNGVLMVKEKAEAYIKAGLDTMYVGIDSSTEENYNKIRVGGDYKKAVKNVLNYRDLLSQHGNGKQQIFVQFVKSDINEHEVEDFRNFWTKNGINVKIRPKVSWGGLIEATNLRNNSEVKRKPCFWLMRTINICADGEIAFCSVDVHCRIKCGNIKQHSIRELWRGKLRQYREMHKQSRFDELPKMCRECADWQSSYAEYSISQL